MSGTHEGDADRLDYMLVCRPHGQADKDWQTVMTLGLEGADEHGLIPVQAGFGRNMTPRACRWLAGNVADLMRFALRERADRLDSGEDGDDIDLLAMQRPAR